MEHNQYGGGKGTGAGNGAGGGTRAGASAGAALSGGAGSGGTGAGAGQDPAGGGRESFIQKAARKLNINTFSVPAFFIKFILATAVSFSIVYAITETSGLRIPGTTVLLFCGALLLGLSLLFLNAFFANGLLLAALATLGGYLYHLHKTDRLEDVRIIVTYYFRRFTYWAASYFYTASPRNERFEFFLFAMICFVVCAVAYVVAIKRYAFALLFAFGFATFCVQWSYGFFASNLAFFVFIGATIVGYVWHIYLKSQKLYGGGAALFTPIKFLKSLAPLFLAMILAVALIPVPNGPIRWQWLYDIVNSASNGFYDRFYYYRVDNFALNTTGFSDGESFLSGPVRLNNTQVLTVRADDPALYLKGNGKEVYTGNSWKNLPDEYVYAADELANAAAEAVPSGGDADSPSAPRATFRSMRTLRDTSTGTAWSIVLPETDPPGGAPRSASAPQNPNDPDADGANAAIDGIDNANADRAAEKAETLERAILAAETAEAGDAAVGTTAAAAVTGTAADDALGAANVGTSSDTSTHTSSDTSTDPASNAASDPASGTSSGAVSDTTADTIFDTTPDTADGSLSAPANGGSLSASANAVA
ncbi:MAG: hypothetical protein LBU58_05200, partial [Clostridiales bacterium]|nr:hypothetical protein [Clostridiales bacterium]